tara:strand:+ start:887 stop:1069 length:183 start_codon:yes stop_codon:yes gene_type:complete
MNQTKTLCSFRFSEAHITKLKRVANLRKTNMTDILERAIIDLPDISKPKKEKKIAAVQSK